ncbi:TPA: fimbrial protein [Escherichia coli]|nr:fimbrial protein [Escherichia coli]
MGMTGARAAPSFIPPSQDVIPIQELPLDTRCSITVSNPMVDYGVMSRWQLKDMGGGMVSPGGRSLTVSVVCPNTRKMRLRVEGGRNERGFSYGEHGFTRLDLLDAQVDGNAVALSAITPDEVIKDNGKHTLALYPGEWFSPVMNGKLAEGKTFTARLDVQPMLTESDARVSRRQQNQTVLTLLLDD